MKERSPGRKTRPPTRDPAAPGPRPTRGTARRRARNAAPSSRRGARDASANDDDDAAGAQPPAHRSLPITGLSLPVKFTLIITATFAVLMTVFGIFVIGRISGDFNREIDEFGAALVTSVAVPDPRCWDPDHGTIIELENWFEEHGVKYSQFLDEIYGIRYAPPSTDGEEGSGLDEDDASKSRSREAAEQYRTLREEREKRRTLNRDRLSGLLSFQTENDGQTLSSIDKVLIASVDEEGKLSIEMSAPSQTTLRFERQRTRPFQVPGADGRLVDTAIEIVEGRDRGEPVRLFSRPITDAAGNASHQAFVLLRETDIQNKLLGIKTSFFLMTLIFIAIGGGVSYFVTRRMMMPIASLMTDIEIIADGDLDHRTTATTHDEIGLLARTIDSMTHSLKEAQSLEDQNLELRHEVGIASEIRSKLLPEKIPTLSGFELDAFHRPSSAVGGDYYDFIAMPDGRVAVIVCGLAGRGVPAAMLMTMARALIRAEIQRSTSAADALVRVNQALHRDIRKGMYVTALCVVLQPGSHEATVVSAGHHALLLHRQGRDTLDHVHPDGIALGLDSGPIFHKTLKEETLSLEAGDRLVLLTEGAYKIRNTQGEEFGEEQFTSSLLKSSRMNSAALVNIIGARIDAFVGESETIQDVTIVTLKVTQ